MSGPDDGVLDIQHSDQRPHKCNIDCPYRKYIQGVKRKFDDLQASHNTYHSAGYDARERHDQWLAGEPILMPQAVENVKRRKQQHRDVPCYWPWDVVSSGMPPKIAGEEEEWWQELQEAEKREAPYLQEWYWDVQYGVWNRRIKVLSHDCFPRAWMVEYEPGKEFVCREFWWQQSHDALPKRARDHDGIIHPEMLDPTMELTVATMTKAEYQRHRQFVTHGIQGQVPSYRENRLASDGLLVTVSPDPNSRKRKLQAVEGHWEWTHEGDGIVEPVRMIKRFKPHC